MRKKEKKDFSLFEKIKYKGALRVANKTTLLYFQHVYNIRFDYYAGLIVDDRVALLTDSALGLYNDLCLLNQFQFLYLYNELQKVLVSRGIING